MASSADAKLAEANAKFELLQREDEQRIRKQGWLLKQGGGKRRANWKKRYFVLNLSKLTYFTDESKSKMKGTIDIVHDPTNRVAPSDHKEHCFFMTRDNARTFFIVAKDDGERNEWIKAVQECFLIKKEQYDRLNASAAGSAASRVSVISPAASPLQLLQDPYDPNIVRHEGWLEKKGGGKTRANWQKRWFVCKLKSIAYYTDQKKTTQKGVIPLDETITASPSAAKIFAIAISVPGRIFLVDAHSEPERNTWLSVILECKKLLEEQKRLKLSPAAPSTPSAFLPPPALAPPPSLTAPPSLAAPPSLSAPPSLAAPPASLSVPPPSSSAPPPSTAVLPPPPAALPPPPSSSSSSSSSSLPPTSAVPSSTPPTSSSSSATSSSSSTSSTGTATAAYEEVSLAELGTERLCEWLAQIGLPSAAIQSFVENAMTGKDLLELSEEELREDLELDESSCRLLLSKLHPEQAAAQPAPPSPSTWDTQRCVEWLKEIGCEAAIPTFVENALTGADLFELTQSEIVDELGIPPEGDIPQKLWKQVSLLKLRHTPVQPGLDY